MGLNSLRAKAVIRLWTASRRHTYEPLCFILTGMLAPLLPVNDKTLRLTLGQGPTGVLMIRRCSSEHPASPKYYSCSLSHDIACPHGLAAEP